MTAAELKRKIAAALKVGEIEAAEFEAKQIVEFVVEKSVILGDEIVTQEQEKKAFNIAERRAKREPLQYILGFWEFYGLPFKVGEGVLIPRPDTEHLVERAIKLLPQTIKPKVLDLCAGSGCVGIAIAKNSDCEVAFFEKSEQSIEYLKENCRLNAIKAEIFKCDVLKLPPESLMQSVDLIVSNPPYIATEVIKTLQREVLREPSMALDGGEDGLIFYRNITKNWKKALKIGGKLAFEIGYDQAEAVSSILANEGFCEIFLDKDYGGNDRVVYGTYKGL